jgi:TolA-binding protein
MNKTAVLFLPLAAVFFFGCVATQSNIDDVHHQLNVLNSRVEEVAKDQKALNAKMDALSADLMYSSEGATDAYSGMSKISVKLDDLNVIVANAIKEKEAAAIVPSKIYGQSYTYLLQKKYEPAVEGFNLYLEKYPKGELAEDAQYYLGDAYAGSKDWQNAALNYAKVLTGYKGSSYTASARLKYAQALLKLEDESKQKEAVTYLKSIIQDFKGSAESRIAQKELDKLEKTSK